MRGGLASPLNQTTKPTDPAVGGGQSAIICNISGRRAMSNHYALWCSSCQNMDTIHMETQHRVGGDDVMINEWVL